MERDRGNNTKILKMLNLVPKRKAKFKYKLDSSDSSVGESDQSSSSNKANTNRNRNEPQEPKKFSAGRKSMYINYWKTQKIQEAQETKKPPLYASTPMPSRKPAEFGSPNVTPIVNLKPATRSTSSKKESASGELVKSASSEIPVDDSANKSDRDRSPVTKSPVSKSPVSKLSVTKSSVTKSSVTKSPAKRPLRDSVENAENIQPNCDMIVPQCAICSCRCGVEKRSFGLNTSVPKNHSIGVCTSVLPDVISDPICNSVQVGTSAVINHSVGMNTSCLKNKSIATNTSRHMKSVGTNTSNVVIADSPDVAVSYNSHNYNSLSGSQKRARQRVLDSSKLPNNVESSLEQAENAPSQILNASVRSTKSTKLSDSRNLAEGLGQNLSSCTENLGTATFKAKKENAIAEKSNLSQSSYSRLTRSRTPNVSLNKVNRTISTDQTEKIKSTVSSTPQRKHTEDPSGTGHDASHEPAFAPTVDAVEYTDDVALPVLIENPPIPEKPAESESASEKEAVENEAVPIHKSPIRTRSRKKAIANGIRVLQSLHFVPDVMPRKLEVIVEANSEMDCVPDAVEPAESSVPVFESKSTEDATKPTKKRGKKATAEVVEAARDASTKAESVNTTSTTTRSKPGNKSKITELSETPADSKLHKVSSSSTLKFKSKSSTKSKLRRAMEMERDSFVNFKGTTTRSGRQVKQKLDPTPEEIVALVYKSRPKKKEDKKRHSTVIEKSNKKVQMSQNIDKEGTDATTRQSYDSGCFSREDEPATIQSTVVPSSGDEFLFVKPTGVPKRGKSKKAEVTNDEASMPRIPDENLTNKARTVGTVTRRQTNKINFPIKGCTTNSELISETPVQNGAPLQICHIMKNSLGETHTLFIKPKQYFDYALASKTMFYTLLKGEAEVRVHDSRTHLNEGDWFEVYKGVEYFVKNAADETMHLNFFTQND